MKEQDLLTAVSGIGKKSASALAKMNIETVGDLIRNYPFKYVDLSIPKNIEDLDNGDTGLIKAEVVRNPKWIKRYGKTSIFSFHVSDGIKDLEVTYFNMPYMYQKFHVGDEYLFMGRIGLYGNRKQMANPSLFNVGQYSILPFYHTCKGISQTNMRKFIRNALEELESVSDEFTPEFCSRFPIMDLSDELRKIHMPNVSRDYENAVKSAKMKEFIRMLTVTRSLSTGNDADIIPTDQTISEFKKLLSFELTNAQEKAIKEIASDISRPKPMNRLLQGDVGSGKTVVALYAMYAAARCGKLSILMAPTQILSEQHYNTAVNILGDTGIALVKGNMSEKEVSELERKIIKGTVRMLIGTHALLYRDLSRFEPSLIVIDEQHRFGVAQRAALGSGNKSLHTLIMSATPIPRSLALILYNRSSITVLDELPKNRKEIKTYIVSDSKRNDMYGFIRDHIDKSEQAYIVAPLIEDNPDLNARSVLSLYDELHKIFDRTEVIYGSNRNKDEIMERFKNGEIDVLISTTVIEVGVDVPNATIMVIENAERFGLSQLHQLRGRVGRGSKESFCFLVSNDRNNERLKIIKESSDGFYIAEKDLELRGTGDIIGQRQSGEPGAAMANIIADADLFRQAEKIVDENMDDAGLKNVFDAIIHEYFDNNGRVVLN